MRQPDLAAVEELCHMQLAARRLGCRILIHDAAPSLCELIELIGLGDTLLAGDRVGRW